jgi:hypothetical protein
MSLLTAPLWLQVALAAEALAVLWLTARHGLRGLLAGLLGGVAFWFVLALAASWLVGRLEGGAAAELSSLLPGALQATLRLGAAAAPLIALAALAGGVLRAVFTGWKGAPP